MQCMKGLCHSGVMHLSFLSAWDLMHSTVWLNDPYCSISCSNYNFVLETLALRNTARFVPCFTCCARHHALDTWKCIWRLALSWQGAISCSVMWPSLGVIAGDLEGLWRYFWPWVIAISSGYLVMVVSLGLLTSVFQIAAKVVKDTLV